MTSVLAVRRDDRFSELLRDAGFEVENLELIATRPAGDLTDLLQAMERLDKYDGLFFTSPAAAEVFVEHVTEPKTVSGKIYVLGERAKHALEDKGFEVVFRPNANTAGQLIDSFDPTEFRGKKFLFVRGDRSLRTIPELLNGTAELDEVVVYETTRAIVDDERIKFLKSRIAVEEFGWACFFSPSGVEEFTSVFEDADLKKLRVAAIGETTATRAESLGLDVQFVSERSNSEEFARGLIEHIKEVE